MGDEARDARRQDGRKAGRRRVLVVDDSAVIRRALTGLLEESGFEVDAAECGEDAFEQCLHEPYSLVVTDQTMAGLSGTQLCRLLRSDPSTQRIPLVLLTADDDPRSRFRARDAGAEAYVAKDRARDELVDVVRRLAVETEPERRATGLVPKPSRRQPLERLGEVLETVLFRAQLGNEVRSLVEHIDSRRGFGRALCGLVAQVAEYDYLVLRLAGPAGTSWVVDARRAWRTDAAALHALGMEGAVPDAVELVGPAPVAGAVGVTDGASFEIVVAGEVLGQLAIHAATKRIARADREIVAIVAEELGVVTKSLFLLEETHRLAHTDGLTGLPNRRACVERLEHEIERARRHGSSLSVAICDIDHFKAVNDEHGHNVGDAVLAAVAKTIAAGVRKVDLVARWGGEEFLVVLPAASTVGGRVVAERLRLMVAAQGAFDDGPSSITMSFGVATWDAEEDAQALVSRADEALYRAKERGRNRVELA